MPLRFSDAILLGCAIAPKKLRFSLFDNLPHPAAACVMGAATVGTGSEFDPFWCHSIMQRWPWLHESVSVSLCQKYAGLLNASHSWWEAFVYLNNHTDLTREQIAAIAREVEPEPEPVPVPVPVEESFAPMPEPEPDPEPEHAPVLVGV